MSKSIRDWLAEGETLYNAAMADYRTLESQLATLEQTLAAKRQEVNQIAQVIGKEAIESNCRLTAELVETEPVNTVVGAVTRALTGRGLGRV